jgi:hypothetical protein
MTITEAVLETRSNGLFTSEPYKIEGNEFHTDSYDFALNIASLLGYVVEENELTEDFKYTVADRMFL